jgi:hypothetical protein
MTDNKDDKPEVNIKFDPAEIEILEKRIVPTGSGETVLPL